jgi:hypothetical protein
VSYNEIRAALRPNGFYVYNLWHLTRLGYAVGRSGTAKNPIIALTIASIAEAVAQAWDGVPVDETQAKCIEDLILPKLQALVELEDAIDETVVTAAVSDAHMAKSVAFASCG